MVTVVRGFVVAAILICAVSSARADVPTQNARVDEARDAVLTDDYQPTIPGDEDDGATQLPDTWPQGEGAGGEGGHARDHARNPDNDGEGTPSLPRGGDRRYYADSDDDTREAEDPSTVQVPVSGVFRLLMWAVIIAGAVMIVLWAVSELARGGVTEAEVAADATVSAEPDLAVIERPLGDADEWARRGNFGEAIHTLLLRTLQELVRSSAVRVAPAQTSREILARVPLLADAREALAGLITAVELTHFRGAVATLDDYQHCRAQFDRFATAFRAGVPIGSRA